MFDSIGDVTESPYQIYLTDGTIFHGRCKEYTLRRKRRDEKVTNQQCAEF